MLASYGGDVTKALEAAKHTTDELLNADIVTDWNSKAQSAVSNAKSDSSWDDVIRDALAGHSETGYNGSTGAGEISIYRAVGPEEFYDIFENRLFRTTDTSIYAKQFGFDFDETLVYADWAPDAAAIIEVKIPYSVLKDIGDFTPIDTQIFKNGTVTIHGDQLDIFNKYITDIFHAF